ncbi:MAG: low temperature requirement protein A [Actinobacteria bacterium]|nr:low temperature requirement protein A [Actinomycetota bacterium]
MTFLSRLLEPPRLRTIEEDERERHATWLELFFDLVFVVAVAQLGESLSENHDTEGFLKFLALFVPVWWAWAGFTFYANRFDTDDLAYRLLCLTGMFTVAAFATNVHDAFTGGANAFALSYVAIRLVILVLYSRAIRHVERARRLAIWYFTAFSLGVVVWLVSLAVAEPAKWRLWALALTIEISAPLVGWRLIPKAPIHPTHVPERFGLLTIIVLGEAVFAVVVGVAGAEWQAESALTAVGGFLAAAGIWWIYFDFVDSEAVVQTLVGGLTYTYSHLPLIAGIVALGIGVKLSILDTAGKTGYADTGWILCGGLALTMFAMAAIQLATPPTLLDVDVWLRLATGAAALVLLPVSGELSPLALVWILAGLLVAQVVFELVGHEEHVLDHTLPGRGTS